MGFFSDLFGGGGGRAAEKATTMQVEGLDRARTRLGEGITEQQGYLGAYAPGLEAQSEEYNRRLMGDAGGFQPSVGFNPLMSHYMNMMSQGRVQGGGFQSGKTQLAGQEIFQRGLLEDYWKQMLALGGGQERGIRLAGQQSDVAGLGARGMAGYESQIGQAYGGGEIARFNANAAASKNLLDTGVAAAKMAAGAYTGMPTGGGQSPIGQYTAMNDLAGQQRQRSYWG